MCLKHLCHPPARMQQSVNIQFLQISFIFRIISPPDNTVASFLLVPKGHLGSRSLGLGIPIFRLNIRPCRCHISVGCQIQVEKPQKSSPASQSQHQHIILQRQVTINCFCLKMNHFRCLRPTVKQTILTGHSFPLPHVQKDLLNSWQMALHHTNVSERELHSILQ